ncbi:MAG: galactokinase [Bacillariaceae sp.]|jgi:galactokinase
MLVVSLVRVFLLFFSLTASTLQVLLFIPTTLTAGFSIQLSKSSSHKKNVLRKTNYNYNKIVPRITKTTKLFSIVDNKNSGFITMETKLDTVKTLFGKYFSSSSSSSPSLNNDSVERLEDVVPVTTAIAVAPGRVNLIGEHTDYTGGFVLPFAIDYSTIVYGRGSVVVPDDTTDNNNTRERKAFISFVSAMSPDSLETAEVSESSTPPETPSWTTYVEGTVCQYLPDLPKGAELRLEFCIAGDVPLGSGLSSSASLEVAVARFVEAILGENAFSSEQNDDGAFSPSKVRALRCQKAENEWCDSPCGIMDQAIISAATGGSLLLIDCRVLDFTPTKMADESLSSDDPLPVLVVANSNVKHSIGGGEYPIRVAQCKTATEALQKVDPNILMLRDATLEDVEDAKEFMDDVIYKRAKHVITENERTIQAKEELERGDWKQVGELMNASHSSMRDDYEVSCEEVDILVDIAQNFSGVYGSRLTGGGFGGCTVTLVDEERAIDLMEHMKKEYKTRTGTDCPCFVTRPARGAHLLSLTDNKPLVQE